VARCAGRRASGGGAALKEAAPRDALQTLIHDIVDGVLFQLLNPNDNNELPLYWKRSAGSTSLVALGGEEMAGWLAGRDWPRRFSRQRFYDHFPDLGMGFRRQRLALALVARTTEQWRVEKASFERPRSRTRAPRVTRPAVNLKPVLETR
jgi:hypothetical protein